MERAEGVDEGAALHERRVRRVLSSPAASVVRPPRSVDWSFPFAMPADVAAFYRACDGIETPRLRVLGLGELADVTQWLVLDRGLTWPPDRVVVGEASELVVTLDLDLQHERAGGGIAVAAADALESFERVGTDLVGWLSHELGVEDDLPLSPELAARLAARQKDARALAVALGCPFYPGALLERAARAFELAALRIRAGDPSGALDAYALGVEARAEAARPDNRPGERAAAWRAAELAARAAGEEEVTCPCSESVARICAERAERP